MKYFLLIFGLISLQVIFGQTSTTIDAGLSAKAPISDLRYSVCYDKFGEGFSRLEGTTFQYFNADFEKVWEKELELVEGYGKYNWFVTGNNGDQMIIAQYGTAFKVDNIEANLISISTEGEMKTIDLGEVFNFRGISGYEFFEDGFMMTAVEAKGTVTPYGNTLKFYTHMLHFDYDLNLQGEIVTLPAFSTDEKHNYIWINDGLVDENYKFVTPYYLKDGKPTDEDKEQGKQRRTITVNKSGKIVTDEVADIPANLTANPYKYLWAPIKFDKERYKVLIEDQELEQVRPFGIGTHFSKVTVEKDGKESDNLITEFWQFVNPKMLTNNHVTASLALTDVIEDKLNDNLILIMHSTQLYTYYVIFLNDDLNIAAIDSYKSYEVGTSYKLAEREFMFYCGSKEESYGDIQTEHVDNAFTKINDFEKEVMHSILIYDDYQLLISDDLKNKTTTVTKFDYPKN